jgi:hypothetical protein
MLLRIAFGVGLLALGYYVGREMGRAESLRRELDRDGGLDDPGPERAPRSDGEPGRPTVDPSETTPPPRG